MDQAEHIKQLQKLLADERARVAAIKAERDALQKRLDDIAELANR